MKELLIISILIFNFPILARSFTKHNLGLARHSILRSLQDSVEDNDSSKSNSLFQDSTRTNENVLKLKKANPFFIRNMMMLSLKNNLEFNLLPFAYSQNPWNFKGFRSQGILRSNISDYLISMRRQSEQRSLGLFGKILGYAQSAAAAYLLYRHVSKYGLGFDRPQKQHKK